MLTLRLAQGGDTALMLACENKHEAAAGGVMEATKRAGALDLQAKEDKKSVLHVASDKGLADTVAKVLALGADAALTDKKGKTCLHCAAEQGHRHVLRVLLDNGAEVAAKDENGCTALMLACLNQHEAAAAELMEATKRAGALDLQVGHEAWVLRACVV